MPGHNLIFYQSRKSFSTPPPYLVTVTVASEGEEKKEREKKPSTLPGPHSQLLSLNQARAVGRREVLNWVMVVEFGY